MHGDDLDPGEMQLLVKIMFTLPAITTAHSSNDAVQSAWSEHTPDIYRADKPSCDAGYMSGVCSAYAEWTAPLLLWSSSSSVFAYWLMEICPPSVRLYVQLSGCWDSFPVLAAAVSESLLISSNAHMQLVGLFSLHTVMVLALVTIHTTTAGS